MATIIPAIRGTLGNTTFYEATMKVGDLLGAVNPPSDLEEWANHSVEERMQREPNSKRVLNQLAPYLANSPDRFFGSIIVLVWKGSVEFEPVTDWATKIPGAYRGTASKMGFVSIDGGKLVVLDGQHRYLALKEIMAGNVTGEHAAAIVNDEVCVILIEHEDNRKTRRIFNTVNRYAKSTTRGENIITSEDDGYAIVARAMLGPDQYLADKKIGGKDQAMAAWKSNTLSTRSTSLTTLSTVQDSVRLILDANDIGSLPEQTRPSDEDIEHYHELVRQVWEPLLDGIDSYREGLADPKKLPAFRADDAKTSLLHKPAAQLGLIDGILRAMDPDQGGLTIKDAVARANRIEDWSMDTHLWRGIIVKTNGSIDAGREAKRRMADLLVYLLAAENLDDKQKASIWKRFNEARGREVALFLETNGEKGKVEDLPAPVEGDVFTSQQALDLLQVSPAKDKAA
ncbi:MAG: DNA sulfur modification protein DndB [Shimia sp.]